MVEAGVNMLHQHQQGGRHDLRGAEFCLVPFKGGLKLIPNLVELLGGAPIIVVVAAIVIIVVVDGTPTLTSSSCIV